MKKGLRITAIIVILLLAIGGAIFYFVYNSKPRLSVSILQFNELATNETNLTLEVKVKNTLPFKVTAGNLHFEIKSNDVVLAENTEAIPVSLNAFRSNTFQVPVRLYTDSIKKISKDLTLNNTDSTYYEFSLTLIDTNSSIIPDTLHFSDKQLLPTFKFPVVALKDIEVNHALSKKKREIIFTISVKNYSNSPIIIKNPSYGIALNDDANVIHGKQIGEIKIDAKSEKFIKAPVTLEGDKLLHNATKILFNKEDCLVRIRLDGQLITQNEMIDGCEIHTRVLANLKDLLDKQKK